MLNDSPLSDRPFTSTFSQSVAFPLPLTLSFAEQKLLIVMKSSLLVFFSCGVVFKISLLYLLARFFSYVISQEFDNFAFYV